MKADRRIYHKDPTGKYRVLVAVPGDEITQDVLDKEDVVKPTDSGKDVHKARQGRRAPKKD